jgi:hypothetical protein
VSEETYYRRKRDLLQTQKRPTTDAKETYYTRKIDLLQTQKRPTTDAKETYYRRKRDLLQTQKRPTTDAKESYYRRKRDLVAHEVSERGSGLGVVPKICHLQRRFPICATKKTKKTKEVNK